MTKNLNIGFTGFPCSQVGETGSRISRSIRRNAESVSHNWALRRRRSTVEVGDDHSSALKDGKDNITFPERRIVSLNKFSKES